MKLPPPEGLSRFGDRLSWAIEHGPLASRGALAQALGVKPQQISNWLARETPPSEASVNRLSEALEVPPQWLRYGTGGNGGSGIAVETAESEDPALIYVRSFREIVRRAGGKNGNDLPDYRRAELIDDLDIQINLARRLGVSTEELHELKGKLERGEPI